MYPQKLNKIINLFETLPEDERRETLVSYADNAKKQEPREGENFDLVDVRKDEECMDTVGVYLHVDKDGKAQIRRMPVPRFPRNDSRFIFARLRLSSALRRCRGITSSRKFC